MTREYESYGPPTWKLIYISAIGIAMLAAGGFLLLHALGEGKAGPIAFCVVWIFGLVFGVSSQFRFVYLYPDRIESRSPFRTRSARWNEVLRLEPHRGIFSGSAAFGYSLHTQSGRLLIPRDLRSIDKLLREIESKMSGQKIIDTLGYPPFGDGATQEVLKIKFMPWMWLSVVVSPLAAGWFFLEFSRTADWIMLVFGILFVWQTLNMVMYVRFTPLEIQVRHLLHTRKFDPQQLRHLEIASGMQGNILQLHFTEKRLKLREKFLQFDAVVLKRHLESMYRLKHQS